MTADVSLRQRLAVFSVAPGTFTLVTPPHPTRQMAVRPPSTATTAPVI